MKKILGVSSRVKTSLVNCALFWQRELSASVFTDGKKRKRNGGNVRKKENEERSLNHFEGEKMNKILFVEIPYIKRVEISQKYAISRFSIFDYSILIGNIIFQFYFLPLDIIIKEIHVQTSLNNTANINNPIMLIVRLVV